MASQNKSTLFSVANIAILLQEFVYKSSAREISHFTSYKHRQKNQDYFERELFMGHRKMDMDGDRIFAMER